MRIVLIIVGCLCFLRALVAPGFGEADTAVQDMALHRSYKSLIDRGIATEHPDATSILFRSIRPHEINIRIEEELILFVCGSLHFAAAYALTRAGRHIARLSQPDSHPRTHL